MTDTTVHTDEPKTVPSKFDPFGFSPDAKPEHATTEFPAPKPVVEAKPAEAPKLEADPVDPDLVARFDIAGHALEKIATTVFCHDELAKDAFARFAICVIVHKDGSVGFGHSDTALQHAGTVRGEAYKDAQASMTKAG